MESSWNSIYNTNVHSKSMLPRVQTQNGRYKKQFILLINEFSTIVTVQILYALRQIVELYAPYALRLICLSAAPAVFEEHRSMLFMTLFYRK